MSQHPWRKQYQNDGGDFSRIEILMPREMRTWLEEMCGKMKLPPWRLIAIALDNERDCANPFSYPVDEPNTVYIEHAYTAEAHKIFKFLQKFKYGLGRDVLMLFRHQIGVPNKIEFALGLRELLKKDLVRESADFKRQKFMEYPPGYKMIRVVNLPEASPRSIKTQKHKVDVMEKKLERQRRKLEQMEGQRERLIEEEEKDA